MLSIFKLRISSDGRPIQKVETPDALAREDAVADAAPFESGDDQDDDMEPEKHSFVWQVEHTIAIILFSLALLGVILWNSLP